MISAALLALHKRPNQPIVIKPAQKRILTVEKPVHQPVSVPSIKHDEQPKPQIRYATSLTDTPHAPSIRRSVRKHHSKHHKRYKINPEPRIAPEVDQPGEEHIVQDDPEPIHAPDISVEADRLIAKGMSVLIEASVLQSKIEEGDNL
jgi:hypothetical protein